MSDGKPTKPEARRHVTRAEAESVRIFTSDERGILLHMGCGGIVTREINPARITLLGEPGAEPRSLPVDAIARLRRWLLVIEIEDRASRDRARQLLTPRGVGVIQILRALSDNAPTSTERKSDHE